MEEQPKSTPIAEVVDDESRTCTSLRKVLERAVSLCAQEAGFQTVEKAALDTLTDMLQATLSGMGNRTRVYAEFAGRVQPTVGDLTMALVDMGLKVDAVGLKDYYDLGHSRPVIPAPQTLPLPKVKTILSAGRRALPPYMPAYFPPLPAPHTYIKTPTQKLTITDYAACREKTAQHKRNLDGSLSKFFASTSPCYNLFPENKSLFPLISPTPVTYLDALVPRDQVFEENGDTQPLNFAKTAKPTEQSAKTDENNENGQTNTAAATTKKSWERINNPFLKPVGPKRPPKRN